MIRQSKTHAGMAAAALAIAIVGWRIGGTARAENTAAMSPIGRLVAEDEIRQKMALFGLLADGDFKQPKDIRALTEQVLAPDIVMEMYDANGTRTMHQIGRDPIVRMTPPAHPDAPYVTRHFMVSTYFDMIAPTRAKTRSTVLFLKVSKNRKSADCPDLKADICAGQVQRALVLVYHDEWAKTAKGWFKTRSELRGDD